MARSLLTTKAVAPSALTARHLDVWREFLQSSPGPHSPFLSPAYVLALGRRMTNVFVGVAEEDGEPIAFLPYERSPSGIGLRLRLCDCQGFIARPGAILDVPRFIRGCGLRAWDFDHLLAGQQHAAAFHRATNLCPVMNLSAGYEAYVAERRAAGTEQIKKTYNLIRRLERENGPLHFEPHIEDPAVLRQLLSWRSGKYQDSRHPLQLVESILMELLTERSPDCTGALSVLFANEEVVACHFGLRSQSVWHYWFPAYNPKFEKLSPGNILLLRIAELAPQLGITQIDLGKGPQDYKRRFMNGAVPLAEGSVTVAPILGAARKLRDAVRRSPLRGLARRILVSHGKSSLPSSPPPAAAQLNE